MSELQNRLWAFIYVLYIGALALLLGAVWWVARILPEVP